ncbi:hypothetical protein KJA15_01510 [Patescibacteria group bacterium]|nr:hypothetical protein [Patescibacteria group bacterium]
MILIYFLFFYLLVLIQTSFLIHFNIFGIIPNFVLISALILNLFERPEKNNGILVAAFGGFFLDIFSEKFIGFQTLILLGMAVFIKLILKRYVRIQIIKKI